MESLKLDAIALHCHATLHGHFKQVQSYVKPQRVRRSTVDQTRSPPQVTASMLNTLPAEIILLILSHLPICDISAFRLLSSSWKIFADVHENLIYQSVAIRHSLALPEESLEHAKSGHVIPWLSDVVNWKDLCRYCVLLFKLFPWLVAESQPFRPQAHGHGKNLERQSQSGAQNNEVSDSWLYLSVLRR